MVRATNTGYIDVRGVIGEQPDGTGISAQAFAEKLRGVGTVDELRIYVNSPGGSAWDGHAMYRQLQAYSGFKVVEIEGLAASAASYFIMAADRIEMGEFSQLMIHSASSGIYGNAPEMRKLSSILDKLDQGIAATYAARTGIPAMEWLKLMAEETYLNSQEALSLRLVDKVIPGYRPSNVNTASTRRTDTASALVRNMLAKQESPVERYLAKLQERIYDINLGESIGK